MRVRYGSGVWEWGMGVGKLKEPGRGESVGFSLLVFMFLGGALAYYCLALPLGSILRGISSAIL